MIKGIAPGVAALLFALLMQGCTTEAWYEGVKRSGESRCRSESPTDHQRCMERLNRKSYQEYEQERRGPEH